jgi:hypothetical protein
MTTKYGDVPNENCREYFKSLVNKTYKILPLKEENSQTLQSYLDSYLLELIGDKDLFSLLEGKPKFITLLSTISYLASEDYTVAECKKEVFKSIHIIEKLSDDLFGKG